MDTMKSNSMKIGGRDVRYYTAGHGEPLVVVHGGGGDARTWRENVAALAENYTVYAPDLPGFGGSQPLEGDYYIPEMAEFVDSFSENLGLDKFYLVGHSIGGGIALKCALKSPQKIRKLVLVSSLCLGSEIALWIRLMSLPARYVGSAILGILKTVKWLLKVLLIPAGLMQPLPGTMLSMGRSMTTFREQTVVLANRLSEIMVPTLVVWGARDPVVPVSQAYAAARVIPNCQLKVFAKRGHNVHRDEIGEFSRLLTGFLG